MLMSGCGLRAAAGKRVAAVELLHCVGDLLWALTPGRPVPNGGYTGEEVQPWSDDGTGDGDCAPLALGKFNVRASLRPVASICLVLHSGCAESAGYTASSPLHSLPSFLVVIQVCCT